MEAKALVLPQWGDGTDLVDDPGVALPFMKGNWGWNGVEECEGSRRTGGGETENCM